jgi:hypothetical protein
VPELFGNCLKCKEMEEIHNTSSSRNLFKMKCLLFCSNWLVNIVDCSRRFNGLTNFKFNCTECVCRVQRRPETQLINAEYGVGKSAVYP